MAITQDEYRLVVQGRIELAALRSEVERQAEVLAKTTSGTAAYAAEEARLQQVIAANHPKITQLANELDVLERKKRKAEATARSFNHNMLNMARLADDAQYGLRGIGNNLVEILGPLGAVGGAMALVVTGMGLWNTFGQQIIDWLKGASTAADQFLTGSEKLNRGLEEQKKIVEDLSKRKYLSGEDAERLAEARAKALDYEKQITKEKKEQAAAEALMEGLTPAERKRAAAFKAGVAEQGAPAVKEVRDAFVADFRRPTANKRRDLMTQRNALVEEQNRLVEASEADKERGDFSRESERYFKWQELEEKLVPIEADLKAMAEAEEKAANAFLSDLEKGRIGAHERLKKLAPKAAGEVEFSLKHEGKGREEVAKEEKADADKEVDRVAGQYDQAIGFRIRDILLKGDRAAAEAYARSALVDQGVAPVIADRAAGKIVGQEAQGLDAEKLKFRAADVAPEKAQAELVERAADDRARVRGEQTAKEVRQDAEREKEKAKREREAAIGRLAGQYDQAYAPRVRQALTMPKGAPTPQALSDTVAQQMVRQGEDPGLAAEAARQIVDRENDKLKAEGAKLIDAGVPATKVRQRLNEQATDDNRKLRGDPTSDDVVNQFDDMLVPELRAGLMRGFKPGRVADYAQKRLQGAGVAPELAAPAAQKMTDEAERQLRQAMRENRFVGMNADQSQQALMGAALRTIRETNARQYQQAQQNQMFMMELARQGRLMGNMMQGQQMMGWSQAPIVWPGPG